MNLEEGYIKIPIKELDEDFEHGKLRQMPFDMGLKLIAKIENTMNELYDKENVDK